MIQFIIIHIITVSALILMEKLSVPYVQNFSRYGKTQKRVCVRQGISCSYGTFPLRRENLCVINIIQLMRWKRNRYEKRYYHQLDSE
jgi:hypothetical protein